MERRFVRAWEELEERAQAAGGLHKALHHERTPDLVAALAGASVEDPVAANVIATELLNRNRRAPYLGAAVVSILMAVMTFVFDWVYTGTPLIVEARARGLSLVGLSLLVALLSLTLYLRWWHLPHGMRAVVEERKRGF